MWKCRFTVGRDRLESVFSVERGIKQDALCCAGGPFRHLLKDVDTPSQNTARPQVSRRFAALLGRAGEMLYGNRTRLATGAAAVLAVTVGYHVVFGQNGLTVYGAKRHDLRDLDVQSQQLQQENARLRGHVERLTNNPDAIEHEARETLHYTRPGEVIYTLPADPKDK